MLIDVHSHINKYQTKKYNCLDEALLQIESNQIITLANSMDINSFQDILEISKKCKFIIPSFGIHPWNAPKYSDVIEKIDSYCSNSHFYGEIGLDQYFVKGPKNYKAQMLVFEYFLSRAKDEHKLLIIHTKGAESEVLELLEKYNYFHAIIHWYSGPVSVLKKMISKGLYFSVGTALAYSEYYQEIVKEIPLYLILSETDNPGGPKSLSGEIGMPALIKNVIENIAKIKNRSFQVMTELIENNFLNLIQNDSMLLSKYNEIKKC